jgi:transcriptional regulator with XRE-family HTH domain
MDFGEKLKTLRHQRNWTQPEAAEQVGIEQSYLSKLENGKSCPSPEIFDRLLEAYELDETKMLAELSTKSRAQLKTIPRVSGHLASIKASQLRVHRAWLLGALMLIGMGAFFVAGSYYELFGDNRIYEYRSKGIVLAGESVDVFNNWREVSRGGEEFASMEKQMYERLDEELLVSWDFRGTQFNVPVDGGSRTYDLGEVIHRVSTPNRVTAALGIAFVLMGLVSLYLSRAWK